ncbi:BTAD domain-containing putative transcriptional regulator [Nocardioides ginsengisoli]|uniref:BTAD domain-containing putative transcriptional regulator n=1 Tax=Nocardioides ginsengisoli TaxID=363868 RepID=A0ABW3W056_9ACTN
MGPSASLNLLGQFELSRLGTRVELAPAGQRVLSLLALLGGNAHRLRLAGTLWPDQCEARSLSNLRSAMWRLPEPARDLVQRRGNSLTLGSDVAVDLDAAHGLAKSLASDHDGLALASVDRDLLARDLLPNEDDAWLVVPREQHRQRRLHALESLALHDLRDGRPFDAVDTALVAVAADPLRESAQLLLVRAHLEAGNRAAAVQHFDRFRDQLAQELGVAPSRRLTELVSGMAGARVTPA